MADTTTIYSPVEGFTGTVVGVDFTDGKGETDDLQALAYFARQGYGIGEPATVETGAEKTENVRPQVQAGTPLRDAFVNPQPGDATHAAQTVVESTEGSGDGTFDPSEHPVDDVNAHLEQADPAEVERVLAAEADGKDRKGIVEGSHAP